MPKRKSPVLKENTKDGNSSKTEQAESVVYDHWLMKSEPESRFENGVDMKFSIDDLIAEPDSTACWDGVRNYQARNFLRDQMKIGQKAFFYHSNCKQPGIVGVMQVVKEGYPDHTQFLKGDPHYDVTSKKENPKWFMVDVKYIRKLSRLISLQELKQIHLEHKSTNPKGPLHNLALFTRARLSVQPLTKQEFDYILTLEENGKDSK